MVVGHVGEEGCALVLARVERVAPARLVAVLGRFANAVAAGTMPVSSVAGRVPSLLVLTPTARLQDAVLAAADQLDDAPVTRHLATAIVEAAMARVAVSVSEPHPAALVSEAVWRSPGDPRSRHLVETLTTRPERDR